MERVRWLFLWLWAALIIGFILFTLAFRVTKPTPQQETEYQKIAAMEDFFKANIPFSMIE